MPNIDKRVDEAIIEEEMTHSITDDNPDGMKKVMDDIENGRDIKDAFVELFLEGAKSAGIKRREKPRIHELDATLKTLKKEIKRLKKERKKRK